MATYKQIFGKAIKVLASDPSNEGLGQIWYNSTSSTFKTILNPAAWSAGGALPTARVSMGTAKQATISSNLIFGGMDAPGTGRNLVESYDGSSWTVENVMPTGRQLNGGAGTQTAALSFGGETGPPNVPSNVTSSYDGTNWTAVNALGTAGYLAGSSGAGTQGAALMFCRQDWPVVANPITTEEWDGTNWAASPGIMNTPRSDGAGTGLQTAALAFGGDTPSYVTMTVTESYDGSTWTTENNLNTSRRRSAGGGQVGAAVAFGGLTPGPAVTGSTETFDGTSWAAGNAMGTGRYYEGGCGATATDSLAIGGLTTASGASITTITEEYTQAEATKTITTS